MRTFNWVKLLIFSITRPGPVSLGLFLKVWDCPLANWHLAVGRSIGCLFRVGDYRHWNICRRRRNLPKLKIHERNPPVWRAICDCCCLIRRNKLFQMWKILFSGQPPHPILCLELQSPPLLAERDEVANGGLLPPPWQNRTGCPEHILRSSWFLEIWVLWKSPETTLSDLNVLWELIRAILRLAYFWFPCPKISN